MLQSREIKVRLVFRLLGGLLSIGILSIFILDFRDAVELWIFDWFNLIGLIVTLPLLIYSTISGKMLPEFILQRISEDAYKDLTNAEAFFKEFNAKSIAFAVVAMTILACFIYRTI